MSVAVVTGAAQGIGYGIAQKLIQNGYEVVALDNNSDRIEHLQESTVHPMHLHFLWADVSNPESIDTALREVRNIRRISALVNNAAVFYSRHISELTTDDWLKVINTNLSGALYLIQALLDPLRTNRGAVVNVASTRALMSEPDSEAYAASKGGLLSLTHALAISLSGQVRINAISPGWIQTPEIAENEKLTDRDHTQHPAGRVGTVEDVSELVSYLLSSKAEFITGANFVVDGGMTRKMIYED